MNCLYTSPTNTNWKTSTCFIECWSLKMYPGRSIKKPIINWTRRPCKCGLPYSQLWEWLSITTYFERTSILDWVGLDWIRSTRILEMNDAEKEYITEPCTVILLQYYYLATSELVPRVWLLWVMVRVTRAGKCKTETPRIFLVSDNRQIIMLLVVRTSSKYDSPSDWKSTRSRALRWHTQWSFSLCSGHYQTPLITHCFTS